MTTRRIRSSGVAILLLLASTVVAGSTQAGELPRYKFKVGQELTYSLEFPRNEYKRDDGSVNWSQVKRTWTVWVVDQNAEAGWRMLFCEEHEQKSNYGGKESVNRIVLHGHFLLSPAGMLTENSTIRTFADPTMLFPPLPPDEAALANGWTARTNVDDTLRSLHDGPKDPSAEATTWNFVEEPRTALDEIYQSGSTREYSFSLPEGLVRHAALTYTQGWPKSDKPPMKAALQLISIRELDPATLAAFVAEADKVSKVSEAYEALFAKARDNADDAASLLDQGKSLLTDLAAVLKVPEARAMATNLLENHAQSASDVLEEAEEFQAVVGKASTAWKTADLAGNPKTLADYRGKVVLLDFWYRGCGWCIRAMPQLKQVADDFRGQEVAVLGINSDDDLADAHFVIDKLGLNYDTLKNGEGNDRINLCYKIHAWPTLVMIDQTGVVRYMHAGYTPTLRHDLGERIRKLLAEKGGAGQ